MDLKKLNEQQKESLAWLAYYCIQENSEAASAVETLCTCVLKIPFNFIFDVRYNKTYKGLRMVHRFSENLYYE